MAKGWSGDSLRHSEAASRREIYVYEWIHGMPKKVAKFIGTYGSESAEGQWQAYQNAGGKTWEL